MCRRDFNITGRVRGGTARAPMHCGFPKAEPDPSPGGDPAGHDVYYDDDDDEAMPRDNDKCDICHTPTNNDSLARCIECHTSACLNCMTDTQRCVLCSEMIDGLEDYYNNIYNSNNNIIDDTTLKTMKFSGSTLKGWSDDVYDGDRFPAGTTKELAKKMAHIAEEFYSYTEQPVLRPTNCLRFLDLHRRWARLAKVELSWDFMELYSGSGRTSQFAHAAGLNTGLCVDFRYGWDLRCTHHRHLVEQVIVLFQPKVLLAAPECRAWSRSATTLDPIQKAELRRRETPMLSWLVKICRRQVQHGYGIIVEQPHGADSWRLSPLKQLQSLPGCTRRRISQCMHGATHPHLKLPVRKDTSLASNLRLKHTLKVCNGGHQHAPLQGRDPRTNLCYTTLAATYPRGLAKALVADIERFVKDDEFYEVRQQFLAHQELPLWTCQRCANGPRTPAHVKHTMIRGECRLYGQPRPRATTTTTTTASGHGRLSAARGLAAAATNHNYPVVQEGGSSASGGAPQAPPQAPAQPPEQPPGPPPDDDGGPQLAPEAKEVTTLSGLKTTIAELLKEEWPSTRFNQRVLDLHARLWHASAAKMRRLLLHAGVPRVRLENLENLFKLCKRCQEYKRPLNRPQVGVSLASRFNESIQMDYMECLGCVFLVIIDECFRYVQARQVASYDASEAATTLLQTWLRYFGNPERITSDQGGSLASTEFGSYLERWGIARHLGGADGSNPAQHTLTGLVERHIELVRTSLLKLDADLRNQECDMFFTYDELVAEVCVGLNSLLIWHGVVPVQGVTGSCGTLDLVDQADTTPLDSVHPDGTTDLCERAILLRHNAKIAVLRALIEQRVARANRAHKQMSEIQPGMTVDLYRRPSTKDFPGWKGPGTVLEVNSKDGTAIIKWQGRPWLMALRHVRPHEGFCPTEATGYARSTWLADAHTHNTHTTTNTTDSGLNDVVRRLMELMDIADGTTPGRLQSYGRLYDEKRSRWTLVATKPSLAKLVRTTGRFVAIGILGGLHFDLLRFGTQIPRLPAVVGPAESTLLVWCRTARMNYIIQTVNAAHSVPIRDVLVDSGWSIADASVIQFVRYTHDDNDDDALDGGDNNKDFDMNNNDDDSNRRRNNDYDTDMSAVLAPSLPDLDMSELEKSTTTYDTDVPEVTWDDDMDLCRAIEKSLKGDDDEHDPMASSSNQPNPEPVLPIAEPTDSDTDESSSDTLAYYCHLYEKEINEALHQWQQLQESQSPNAESYGLQGPSLPCTGPSGRQRNSQQELLNLYQALSGECYRVDIDTDNLSASDMQQFESEITASDRKEVKSFVDHEVWDVAPVSEARNLISCTWVRKWKRKEIQLANKRKEFERVVKSRLCCRGFLDKQKSELFKYASTASRLSQKMLISNAALHGWTVESWDVSTAFLRGLTFAEIDKIARELNVPSPLSTRTVYVQVPGNVWRHLKDLGAITQEQYNHALKGGLCLKLRKAMYGLCDAPALWQLALQHYVTKTMLGRPCLHDSCHFYFRKQGQLSGEATAHVDDTCFSGNQSDLDARRQMIEKRFGSVSRQVLPFQHVGITYERTQTGGFRLHQEAYCLALRTAEIPRGIPSERTLTPPEVTQLRAILGALLYLVYTRPDIAADVVLLASRVTVATVADLRQANAVVRKAQANARRGLVFERLTPPLTILSISDASFSTSNTSYAIEGMCVFLCESRFTHAGPRKLTTQASVLNGPCHLLIAGSHKAKRVSHSTSHAESLACYSSLQHAEIVASRLTEAWWPWDTLPTVEQMIMIEDRGTFTVPVIALTDCNDLLELISGARGVPQDKSQRLIILSLRERRVLRKTVGHGHIDTRDMIANALTKRVQDCAQLGEVLTTGHLRFNFTLNYIGAPLHVEPYDENTLMR